MFEAIESNNRKYIKVIIAIVTIVFSFLVIREGFYMDEAGLLSTYKPVYQGERLFIDIWGELQLGGILTYPLFALYYNLLEPILYSLGIGFVLYTRICYQIVRLLISIYLYLTIRKTDYKSGAFWAALAYYLFFVSFKNFSYKSMCDFGIMLFLCWGIRYIITKNNAYFILMGLATCISILAYPTMIIFPFIFVIYMIIAMFKGNSFIKPIIIYSITCFFIGGLVLLYLQITAGIQNILPQFLYIEDQAYGEPGYIRFGMMIVRYFVFFVIAYLPILVMNIASRWKQLEWKTYNTVLSLYWIIFMAVIIGLRIQSVSTTRLIYGFLLIFFWYPYLMHPQKNTEYVQIGYYKQSELSVNEALKFVFWFSAIIQLIWAVSTNQEIAIPGHMCFYVVIALLILSEDCVEGLKLLRLAIVVCLLFFGNIWIAEGNGGYNHIFEKRIYVEHGAFRGIALDEADYEMNEDCCKLADTYLRDEDRVFVLHGYCYTVYLNSNAHQGPGPYARAGVGQNRVLQYWTINSEDVPDYVIINRKNEYYSEFENSDTAKYIFENYKTTVAKEGNFILLAR